MDVDRELSKLGRWGAWQRRALLLLGFSGNVVLAVNMLSIVFMGVVPPYRCKSDLNDTDSLNTSLTQDDPRVGKCLVNINDTDSTSPCTNGWHYTLRNGPTIVSDWDLVCDKNYYVDLSQTLFMVGLSLGDLFVTALSDYFGRKKAHIGCAVLSGILGIILAFVPNFTAFAVVRFLMGIVVDAVYCTSQVWLTEHFAVHNRVIATSLGLFFWSPGMWLLDLLAYFIPGWRYLSATIGVLCIFPISYIWLLDESLPWLEASNKSHLSQQVLQRARRMNGLSNDQTIRKDINEKDGELDSLHAENGKRNNPSQNGKSEPANKESTRLDNLLSVVRHGRLCAYSIIFALLWFTTNLAYYGILLGAGSFIGNLYINYILFGVMESLADVGVLISAKWFGRRPCIIVGQITVGIGLVATEFIPKQTASGHSLVPLILAVVMVGYCGTTLTFADICVYTPEVYPTHVRNLSYGIAMTFGRLGGIIAPFYSYAKGDISWVPAIVVGTIAIVSGLLTFILPETRERPLFQTIEEMDKWQDHGKESNRQSS